MEQDPAAATTAQTGTNGAGPSAGASGETSGASGQVRSALRGQSFQAQEATLAPRPVQRKRSSGAPVQRAPAVSAGASRDGIEGSVNIPSQQVAYSAQPGFTTKWTMGGGCGWKISRRHGAARPADQPSVEAEATGGPIELGGNEGGGGGEHESGPEIEGEINREEVGASVKQEVLGGLFSLGANVAVGEHGVGGGITASCDPGTIQLANGVSLRVPAVRLKLADYNPETKELSICALETTVPIFGADFTIHRPNFDIKISPHLELKFKLEPNWFTIAERLGIELAADAGVGEAALAVGVELMPFIAPVAVGAALLGIAAHEFREGDELVDAANSTASNVYTYCSAYARSWMSGQPTNGPGGRAAHRDIEIARRAHPGLQVAAEAEALGEDRIYRRVFEIVGARAIAALKARIRRARHLRGSEALTIEDRVQQAQWGGHIWRAHGAIPAPRAERNQPDEDAEENGSGHGGGGEHGGGRPASPGVTANDFDPELAALTARGTEIARIHSRERGLLGHLNQFKESALVSERHGTEASAVLSELVNFYRDRYVPKVLALREHYRRLHVSEPDWKVDPHYARRRDYDPDLTWAKSLAEHTVGVPHPNDPRLAAIDGFVGQLRR